ncbi:MAG: hypothetical protein AB1941_00760 [Gemmatimonadota bacterium]
MSKEAVVLLMMRRIYDLAGGDPAAEVDPADAGGGFGLSAEGARGYTSVLERLGHLAYAGSDSSVRLTPIGAEWVEARWPSLRQPAGV